ncbi:uncharacterized protein EV420DRAFT_540637 [Desarmillaria tabescens]|uniref:F-box domain-containing protein n=1 Tax=Armillaria tabescens TaxID=1929756 RepID=A0AA39K9S7_ARMTA|nr:uncharacterized protein EV420DRAFT_540637 [Desarmillaria tabescens]KAK0457120.1 hypothetical protein EV420DRAFT_540637 [Desarmillaria tabescens]
MAPSFETLPRDVLEHVALLTTSSLSLSSLSNILYLLLTSRAIHHQLCIRCNPHLYARIFRAIFDVPFHRSCIPPDSAVAAELSQRFRLIRRIQRSDYSTKALRQDLWTAYGMVLENEGLNVSHLRGVGFLGFLDGLVRKSITEGTANNDAIECMGLAIWLLALTITRRDINSRSEASRDELLLLLRPFVLSMDKTSRANAINHPRNTSSHVSTQKNSFDKGDIIYYSHKQTPEPSCPNLSSAVIILTFALKQGDGPRCIPPDIPVNRAAATAMQWTGPTQEDYYAVASYKTPLFADVRQTSIAIREESRTTAALDTLAHEYGYGAFQDDPCLHQLGASASDTVYRYIHQSLPGVWEGMYLVSPLETSSSSTLPDDTDVDFICQSPMQCAVSVHFCYSPNVPVSSEHMGEDPLHWNVDPLSLFQSPSFSKNGRKTNGRREYCYDTDLPSGLNAPYDAWRDPGQALDCIITGKTLEGHDEAWGAYKFYGRVYRDGSIVMKRVPKNSWETGLGTWIFEGHLGYGASWVGKWRSSVAPGDVGPQGIFSMRKRGPEKT